MFSPTLPRDFNRDFLALATRAIDTTFYKKRIFVMADTFVRVMAVTFGDKRLARRAP